MEFKEIKAKDFKDMVLAGRQRLEEQSEYVNSLNVFPVPDGDTGTNMNLTFTSGAKSVRESSADHVGQLAKALSKGLLMGARGNSGVILSQLFRGFSKSVEELETLNAKQLAQAFQSGVDSAYNAVMKPVEGTVLTVARESAKVGVDRSEHTDDIIEVMRAVLDEAKASLKRTPDLLEVLKEVGVVDSGGQGLVYVYEGFLSSLTGEAPVVTEDDEISLEELVQAEHHRSGVHDSVKSEDIEFGYCTEIMVRVGEGETVEETFDYETFRNYLNDLGDSLLVVADDEIIKVHVHTERPGEVMNYGQKFGSLIKIKVDNMREQHSELSGTEKKTAPDLSKSQQPKKPKETAIIAIAAGEGLKGLFESLGVDYVLTGGQTMNPSTEDIVEAMNQTPAKSYIILPNNKNIFMAAEQACEVIDVPAKVVETKTIQQGFSALLGYIETQSLDENVAAMTEEISFITSGQITHAVRDTEINGVSIKKDDFLGIIDGEIKVSRADRLESLIHTIQQMVTDDSEIITLFFGEAVSEKEADEVLERLEDIFDAYEIETHRGDQPVYPYLISVE
ncbi:DAK2 domain-containing protein [Dolosigranulum savutiense]|uniref:DAK2 domain-containing protein n=1 Tax=Dolosigranulum savutiense TaxID=3110288 RepID=A0AB74TUD6_9LACT